MFKTLSHFLIPHVRNNHRAKILHNSSLAIMIVILLVGSFIINRINISRPDVLGVSYSISENDLLAKVNEKRQQNSLPPLSVNTQLDDAARRKAADMLSKNYWAHFAPDGSSSPWGFINAAGYNYIFAGENLAKGFTDSGSIVEAWMNSPTHRDNILSTRYKEVGFAIVPGTLSGEETVLVVQMFGARTNTTAQVPQVAAAQVEPTPFQSETTPTPTPIQSEPTQALLSPTPIKSGQVAIKDDSSAVENKPLINGQITSKAASTVGLSLIAFVFAMDLLIVERKKVPRFVGHNIDHIILISLFILFVVLQSRGFVI